MIKLEILKAKLKAEKDYIKVKFGYFRIIIYLDDIIKKLDIYNRDWLSIINTNEFDDTLEEIKTIIISETLEIFDLIIPLSFI